MDGTTTYEGAIEGVGSMAKFISDYGFMIVFCGLVLIGAFVFFWNYIRQMSKKSDSELSILTEERKASLDQSKQMFELVTTVQTEQVSQLQMMTDSLKSMNSLLTKNGEHIDGMQSSLSKMGEEVTHIRKDEDDISEILDDIQRCVHESSRCNVEILTKVQNLEKTIHVAQSLKNQFESNPNL